MKACLPCCRHPMRRRRWHGLLWPKNQDASFKVFLEQKRGWVHPKLPFSSTINPNPASFHCSPVAVRLNVSSERCYILATEADRCEGLVGLDGELHSWACAHGAPHVCCEVMHVTVPSGHLLHPVASAVWRILAEFDVFN